MDVLTSGVDPTNGGQRACVLRYQRDAHSISPHPPGQCLTEGLTEEVPGPDAAKPATPQASATGGRIIILAGPVTAQQKRSCAFDR